MDDWERLEVNPLLLGRAAREAAFAGWRAGAVDLDDVRSLVPAYDRDRGSILPTYRRERDVAEVWKANLATAIREGLIVQVKADHLSTAFDRFQEDYVLSGQGLQDAWCRR